MESLLLKALIDSVYEYVEKLMRDFTEEEAKDIVHNIVIEALENFGNL